MKTIFLVVRVIAYLVGLFFKDLFRRIGLMGIFSSANDFFKDHALLMAKAIESNDMEQLKNLAPGHDLGLKGEKGMDLMWFAIYRENFDAIRTLVELGVNPDKQLAEGLGSALAFTFMKHDDTRYLKAMLDGGLSPNYISSTGSPLLYRAVSGGLQHVKLLLQRGARIDDRTAGVGYTALHQAIFREKFDVAIYLLRQGADFNVYTVNGLSIAWLVYDSINDYVPGSHAHTKLLALRDLMMEKGVKWPPDSPVEVREQMRARGETPVVPHGLPR